MREMRFPLNNSRPVRFADLSTSQAEEQTLPYTHTCMQKDAPSQPALTAEQTHLNTLTASIWVVVMTQSLCVVAFRSGL